MDKIILELVDGKPEPELMFSKERMLAGISNVLDYVGLTTAARLFYGDDVDVTVSADANTIMTIDECAKYMRVSKNWIYKNSHILPKLQNGKKGNLHFRKSDIDNFMRKSWRIK